MYNGLKFQESKIEFWLGEKYFGDFIQEIFSLN